MLKIKIGFNKGIFFIRLSGNLTKMTNNTFVETVLPIILTTGIRNIIINLDNLSLIDNYGIETLSDISDIVSKENGKLALCSLTSAQVKNRIHKSNFMSKFYESESELTAIGMMKI